MNLIDKSALVAEIEKLVDKGKYHEEYDCAYRDGNNGALYALKNKLDTLEVKEVDEQKERMSECPYRKVVNKTMDKVKKIREEVKKLHGNPYYMMAVKDVLAIIDPLQEEPISEKKCMFTKDSYTDEDRKVLCKDCDEKCEYSKKEEPISEDLEKEIDSYIKANFTIDKEQLDWFGIKEEDYMYSMDKSDMKKMVRYFTGNYKIPVSDDLEEAAKLCVSDSLCITNEDDWDDAAIEALNMYKAGAEWADNHPKEGLVDINSVCGWLITNINDYIETSFIGEYIIFEEFRVDDIIKDFRKAMEKGE